MNRRELLKAMGLASANCLLMQTYSQGQEGPAVATGPGVSSHDLFEAYDRRFAEARLRRPHRDPAQPQDRAAIVSAAKQCLGVRDEWVPTIRAEAVRVVPFEGGRIEVLRAPRGRRCRQRAALSARRSCPRSWAPGHSVLRTRPRLQTR